jgi:hypothetical protein
MFVWGPRGRVGIGLFMFVWWLVLICWGALLLPVANHIIVGGVYEYTTLCPSYFY